jgi:hypothetical protein
MALESPSFGPQLLTSMANNVDVAYAYAAPPPDCSLVVPCYDGTRTPLSPTALIPASLRAPFQPLLLIECLITIFLFTAVVAACKEKDSQGRRSHQVRWRTTK